MMCLSCGETIDAGVALCPECGKSPYEPPEAVRAPNSPSALLADELVAGLVANAAPPAAAAPEPLPLVDLTESQQRRVAFLLQKLEADPNQPKALLGLAQVYEEAGDVTTALNKFRQVGSSADSGAAALAQGACLVRLGQWQRSGQLRAVLGWHG